MRRLPFRRVGYVCSLFTAGAMLAVPAAAHISLDQGSTQKSRYGDNFLKEGPCGKAGGTRGTNVYTYAPGETVPVEIVEFIPHPSYFRVAFDSDGDDAFAPPASILPVDPKRPCPFNAADKCGTADYYNNDSVLPGMDDLNPHLSAPLGQKYTFNVKMPNVECDNCTLQIIQVMEDTIHGAYNPVQGDPADTPYVPDIYYQCIDLILKKGAGPVSDAGAGATGTDGGATSAADGGAGGPGTASKDSSSGCAVSPFTTSAGGTTSVGLFALAALALGRRRARA